MRSVLYVPAEKTKALAKIPTLGADHYIIDLEDSISPDVKAAVLDSLGKVFPDLRSQTEASIGIRVNEVSSDDFQSDMSLVRTLRPESIVIPKFEHPGSLAEEYARLDAIGYRPRLWLMIETPMGILKLAESVQSLVQQGVQLEALVVGTNDIAKTTGVDLSQGRESIQSWLSLIVLVGKAYGLAVLDGVYNNFSDQDGFIREARASRAMGFDGKTLIHPSQIEPANTCFAPTAEEIARAQRIVEAFQHPDNARKGVISVDGEMVELLHLEMARKLLARAGGPAGTA